jgi:hypothetical protein
MIVLSRRERLVNGRQEEQGAKLPNTHRSNFMTTNILPRSPMISPCLSCLMVVATVLPTSPGKVQADERTVASQNKLNREHLKHQRKKLAQRRRRIVFNNDGDDIARVGTGAPREELVGEKLKKSDIEYPVTADGFLKVRTKALLGTHVDAVWYYSTWGMKLHHGDGPFGRLYGCPDAVFGGRSTKNYTALTKTTGKDCLEIMIEFCRKHGMEVFYSNRMNDVHDSFNPAVLYHLRQKHPEWCLSTHDEGSKHSYPDVRSCWSAWNFAVPEVRNATVEALREVCRTYDIDGIELDFFRHFVYFPETLEFKPVTPEHLALMNDMMRKIRAAADEEGLRRGRPILLVGRCLEDVELSKNSGLDVETWLREDLVDMLSAVNSTEHTAPVDELTALARRFETPVYPMVGPLPTAVPDDINNLSARMGNLPVWRGHAINLFAQGAAGIQFFNIFDPTVPQWSELGEPEQMLTKDRTYVWDFRPSQREDRPTFAQMRITRYKQPVPVGTKGCEPIPLYVGEDLRVPDASGKPRKLTLRVRVRGLKAAHGIKLRVGDRELTKPTFDPVPTDTARDTWLRYPATAAFFREGKNEVVATTANEAGSAPSIDQVRLDVRY